MKKKLLLLVLVGPLVAVIIGSLLITLEGSIRNINDFISISILIYISAFVIILLFGLPIHFMLQKFGFTRRLQYGAAGFLIPYAITLTIIAVHQDWHDLDLEFITFMLIPATCGLVVSLTIREFLFRLKE